MITKNNNVLILSTKPLGPVIACGRQQGGNSYVDKITSAAIEAKAVTVACGFPLGIFGIADASEEKYSE